jgi:L,D-transpeptidase YcbB
MGGRKPLLTLPRNEILPMIGPIYLRLMFSMAAIAFCLSLASTPVTAQSDTPQTDTQKSVTPQSNTPQSNTPQSDTRQGDTQKNDASPKDTQNDTQQIQASKPEEAPAPPDFGPQTAQATAEAARRYAEIAASGGWPRIAKPVGPAAKGKPVIDLRRRLAAENFLAREDADAPVWDAKLTDALKRFQSRVGLNETGTVSPATLRELNVPAAARARSRPPQSGFRK